MSDDCIVIVNPRPAGLPYCTCGHLKTIHHEGGCGGFARGQKHASDTPPPCTCREGAR